MPKKKIIDQIAGEVASTEVAEETQEVPETQEVKPDSPEKANFRIILERYKKQNPKKYAIKEQVLLNKLNSL